MVIVSTNALRLYATALCLLIGTPCTRVIAENHGSGRPSKSNHRLLPYSGGDGRWGYIDDSGKVIVPTTFGSASFLYGGFGIVKDMDGKCGYIDSNGKLAIPVQFTFCGTFSQGLATIQFNKYTGTDTTFHKINEQGKVVFPTTLYVGEFVDNVAPARKDMYAQHKCGYIDIGGNWLTPPAFDYCGSLSDGLAKVEVGTESRKCGYVDRKGKVSVPLNFERCLNFNEGLAVVAVYVKWKDRLLVDTSLGRFILRVLHPPNDTNLFEEPPSWYPQISWGYINQSGTWAIAPQYENASSFSEGWAAVGKDGEMGYIDTKGKTVLKSQFVHAEGFRDGYAKVAIGTPNKGIIVSPVQSTEKWGVIDKDGHFVHTARFPSSFDFEVVYNGTIRIVEDLGGSGWETPGKKARTTYVSVSGDVIWPKPPSKGAKPVHSDKPLGQHQLLLAPD